MRVISGKYKGKKLQGFDIEGTRPTMDRVKESLFAMIQNNVKDSICLDLFAGSGSLGIEALSNGAAKCYFIDKSREIIQILKQNLKDIENGVVVEKDYEKALQDLQGMKFDIIFLDPPYQKHLINSSIELLLKYDLIKDQGMVICEYETEKIQTSLKLLKEKKYGNKIIKIYQKEN